MIVQSDLLNHAGHPTTIVVPGTTQIKRDKNYYPLRVALTNQPGLHEETDLLIDQIRAISNKRLMGTMPIATLSINHMRRVEAALKLLTT